MKFWNWWYPNLTYPVSAATLSVIMMETEAIRYQLHMRPALGKGVFPRKMYLQVTLESSRIFAPRGITCFRYCMKIEPFGYLLALERSLSATPSASSVTAKTAGSRPARYLRWACKPEAQFQCALSRNNVYAIAWTFPSVTHYRNGLQRRGLHHRIAYVACFRVVPLTPFRIFVRKYPFSRSGSHVYILYHLY